MSDIYDIHYTFKERSVDTLEYQEILEMDEYIRKKLDVDHYDSTKQKKMEILAKIALESPSADDRIQATKKLSILKKQIENEQKRRLLKEYLIEVIPVLENIERYSPTQFFGCRISKEDDNYKLLTAEKIKFAEIAERYAQIRFKKIPEVLNLICA